MRTTAIISAAENESQSSIPRTGRESELRRALFQCFAFAGRTKGSLNRKITKVCVDALGYRDAATCAMEARRLHPDLFVDRRPPVCSHGSDPLRRGPHFDPSAINAQ